MALAPLLRTEHSAPGGPEHRALGTEHSQADDKISLLELPPGW